MESLLFLLQIFSLCHVRSLHICHVSLSLPLFWIGLFLDFSNLSAYFFFLLLIPQIALPMASAVKELAVYWTSVFGKYWSDIYQMKLFLSCPLCLTKCIGSQFYHITFKFAGLTLKVLHNVPGAYLSYCVLYAFSIKQLFSSLIFLIFFI